MPGKDDLFRRQKQYKNAGKFDDARRRRADQSVELRKAKKDDFLMKRRNIECENDQSLSENDAQYHTNDISNGAAESQNTSPAKHLNYRLSLDEIVKVVSEATNPTLKECRLVAGSLRRLLSVANNPPIKQVNDAGLIEVLIRLLGIEDDEVAFETLWALTNILSGDSWATEKCVSLDCITPILKYCRSQSNQVAEQAIWALANIIGDSAKLRDECLKKGAMEMLLEYAHTEKYKHVSQPIRALISWTLSNIVRHRQPGADTWVIEHVLQVLLVIVQLEIEEDVLRDAFWALSYISDQKIEITIPNMIKLGLVQKLVDTLRRPRNTLMPPILRCLGNVVFGTDEECQSVIDAGLLEITDLQFAMESTSNVVKKEMMWLLSNIAAGSPSQVEALMRSAWLNIACHVMEKGDQRSAIEASYALANVSHHKNYAAAVYMIENTDIIECCAHTLEKVDTRVVGNVIDTLQYLFDALSQQDGISDEGAKPNKVYENALLAFESANGLDKLESMQEEAGDEIYEKIAAIIDTHFNDDDTENETGDAAANPQMQQQVFDF